MCLTADVAQELPLSGNCERHIILLYHVRAKALTNVSGTLTLS